MLLRQNPATFGSFFGVSRSFYGFQDRRRELQWTEIILDLKGPLVLRTVQKQNHRNVNRFLRSAMSVIGRPETKRERRGYSRRIFTEDSKGTEAG